MESDYYAEVFQGNKKVGDILEQKLGAFVKVSLKLVSCSTRVDLQDWKNFQAVILYVYVVLQSCFL